MRKGQRDLEYLVLKGGYHLSSAIAIAQNIRETLERCLQIELNEVTLDSYDNEDLRFYEETAQARGIPVSVFVAELRQAVQEHSKDAASLIEAMSTATTEKDRIFALKDLCQAFSEFIWDYWDSFPPTLRTELVEEFSDLLSSSRKGLRGWLACKLMNFKEKVRLFVPSLLSGIDLFHVQRCSRLRLLTSLLEAMESESGKVSQETLVHLSQDINTIQDLPMRQLLQSELQQVKTVSDLHSLRETVHLFRSKKNGERLRSALQEADSGVLEANSLEALREECGFGKEWKDRQQSVG